MQIIFAVYRKYNESSFVLHLIGYNLAVYAYILYPKRYNIYADGELNDSTHKDFLLVRQEGNRQVQRNIVHYNLDMIIALGYRVQS